MFFLKGWTPLSDITRLTYEFFLRHPRAKVDHPGLDASEEALNEYRYAVEQAHLMQEAVASGSVWDCILSAPEVGILLPSGQIVLAGCVLTETTDMGPIGEHIDIWIGTVGSADWLREDGRASDASDKAKYYGPFIYCPIVLPQIHARDFLLSLGADQDEAQLVSEGEKEKSQKPPARRILDYVAENPNATKAEIKAALFPQTSFRKFAVYFSLASTENSALSLPGRRPKS